MADNIPDTDFFDDPKPKSLSEAMGESFWLALLWLLIVVFFAFTAELWPLPEYDYMDWDHPAAEPGIESRAPMKQINGERSEDVVIYLLGTDTMGRDIVTRLIFGARVSLMVGLVTPCFGLVIGGILGMLAGFYRGRIEWSIMVIMDAILAFPGLVLLLVITFYLGPSLRNIIFALGFLTIPHFARVARANTLTFAEHEFVQSARMLGMTDINIMLREILPNIIMPLIVYALLVVSYMIVAEGALSFLGLGVPAPTPSWGGMIAEGKEVLDEAPHVSLFPALVLFLTVLSFNLIGDSLKRVLDSKEGQL
ncbi:ABC transporter permease [Desulfococcaceae bacterium HSG7]|nr:ABC transporter permease [Desulfococcaceae bacterium HSG7]